MSEAVTKGGAVAGGEEVVTVAETAGEEVEAMPEIELSSDEEVGCLPAKTRTLEAPPPGQR